VITAFANLQKIQMLQGKAVPMARDVPARDLVLPFAKLTNLVLSVSVRTLEILEILASVPVIQTELVLPFVLLVQQARIAVFAKITLKMIHRVLVLIAPTVKAV